LFWEEKLSLQFSFYCEIKKLDKHHHHHRLTTLFQKEIAMEDKPSIPSGITFEFFAIGKKKICIARRKSLSSSGQVDALSPCLINLSVVYVFPSLLLIQ